MYSTDFQPTFSTRRKPGSSRTAFLTMFNTIYIMFLAYGFMHSVISVCVIYDTCITSYFVGGINK